ncbi:hydrophobin [Moniliophthora roreri MCA 2997]|uniref:Hydrophobin n=2 Tax=Moniliophthora roreri TaxID=221103 RepID=V2X449_MONRO|nr:hydrophobin [Moniliophthora roreri MCA 2997]KAI3621414.1 hydrophobin [Moniliophthora roreri]
MFKLFILAALASVVVAAPYGSPVAQCNTGPMQCCNIVDNAQNHDVSNALGLLNIVVQDLNVPIGLNCDPISVVGLGGNACSQQPVCCENNNFNGLVAIGCTPINLNV